MEWIDGSVLGGLKSILGDTVLDISQVFADQLEPDLAALQACHASGEWSGLRKKAHALKGAAANVGAIRVVQLSAAIEKAADDGASAEAILVHLQALPAAATETLTAMRQLRFLRPVA